MTFRHTQSISSDPHHGVWGAAWSGCCLFPQDFSHPGEFNLHWPLRESGTPGCALAVLRGFVFAVPSIWNTLFPDPNCVIKFNWKVTFWEASFLTTWVASSLSGSCHPVLILYLTLTSTCNFLDLLVIFFWSIFPLLLHEFCETRDLISFLHCPVRSALNMPGTQ